MRLMIVAALAALSVFGQDTKVAPIAAAPSTSPAVKAERPLDESEVLKIRLSVQKIKNLQDKYHLADYQRELQPVSDEQRAVYIGACRSVGVPAEKVFEECEFSTGYDQDDKLAVGPDGKPVAPHVKWVKPAAASVTEKK